MTPPISIRVFGTPKGQPRARATVRGRHAAVYDPGTADDWKGDVQRAARPHLPTSPLVGPLRVDISFVFQRPQSHFRKNGELKSTAPILHESKPDRDNLDKAVLDALTAIGMWRDDCQACGGAVTKRYTSPNELPGAYITIQPATT